ncbi:ATP-binding protein [Nonomuraea sp. NPDC002799]
MPVARQCVKAVLAGVCCDFDDVLLVVSELVSNAVRHTRSGVSGGRVRVVIELVADDVIGVEVIDDGSAVVPYPCKPGEDRTDGRGLWLVDDLTEKWGVRRFGQDQSVVWAQVPVEAKKAEVLTTEKAAVTYADVPP